MQLSRLTFFIKAAEITQRALTNEMLDGHGLTYAQLAIILTIQHVPGQSSAALARMHGITPQSAGEIIATLAKQGWVQRIRDTEHAKVFRIYPTPIGTRMIEDMQGVLQSIEDLMIAGISNKDLEITKKALRQIVINGNVVANPLMLSSLI